MNGMMLSPGGLPFKTASIFTDSLAVTRQRMAAIPGRIMRKGKEVAADVTIAGQDAASAIGTELKDVGSGNVPWTQARRAERAALKEEKRRTSYMRNLGHGLFGAGIVGGTAYIASRTPDTPDPYAGMPTNTYRGA